MRDNKIKGLFNTVKENNTFLLVVILLVGLILRLGLLVYFWNKPLKIVDENHYQLIAENIFNYHEFAFQKGHPTSMRPPLYPAFLSAVYVMTGGIHPNAARVAQIVLSLGIIFMVYLLGKKLFGKETGLLAALIFAVYPSFLFFTHYLLTEVLFTFIVALFVWFFLLFLETKKDGYIGWAGFFLGLASLTKSMLYLFITVVFVWLCLMVKETLWKRGKWVILFMAGYGIIIAPWAIRNTLMYHSLVPIESAGGINVYTGNYEHTPMNRAWTAIDLTGDKTWYYGHESTLSRMNEAQKGKWAFNKAKEFILSHKLLTLKRDLIKLGNFWGLERVVIAGIAMGYYPGLDNKAFLIALTFAIFSSYTFVVLLAVLGFANNLRHNRHDLIFVLLLIFYFSGIYTISVGHSRYHLPLIPFLSILASWSLLSFKTIWERRNTWQVNASVFISIAFVALWIREIVFIDGVRYFHYLKGLLSLKGE